MNQLDKLTSKLCASCDHNSHHIAFDGSIGDSLLSKSIVESLILSFFNLSSNISIPSLYLQFCITKISLNHQFLLT